MAHREHEDRDSLIFNAAHRAVVPDSISSEAAELVPKRLTEAAWILIDSDSLSKIRQYNALYSSV